MNGRSILFAIWCGFTFATPALGQNMAKALDLLASARESGAVTAWRSAHAAFESATNQPAHESEIFSTVSSFKEIGRRLPAISFRRLAASPAATMQPMTRGSFRRICGKRINKPTTITRTPNP